MKSLILLFIAQLSMIYTDKLEVVAVLSVQIGIDNPITKVGASYVRWLESSGAEAVAIHPWNTDEELNLIFSKVNGILIQGYQTDIDLNSVYSKTIKKIIEYVINKYETDGIIIPLMAIDRGMHYIMAIIGENVNIIDSLEIQTTSTINIDKYLSKTTRLFSSFSDSEYNLLKDDVAVHLHSKPVSVYNFRSSKKLSDFFRITSTGISPNGVFINTIESYKYPIYGTQFHPEAVAYIRNPIVSNSLSSIRMARLIGNFFIDQCRMNDNTIDITKTKDYINVLVTVPKNEKDEWFYYFEKN